jgi:hypothetical protein
MSGMGIFPDQERLRAPKAGEHYEMPEIDNLLARSALNFRPQKDVLKDIPKKRQESALQIYYW